MTVRTTSKTVTFTHPFNLSGMDEVQPAGTYTVETDEELLQTSSLPAYMCFGVEGGPHPKRVSKARFIDTNSPFRWGPGRRRWRPHHNAHFHRRIRVLRPVRQGVPFRC